MHCVDRNETILCMVVVRAGAIGKKLLVKLNSPSSSPPARALLPDGSVACPEDPLRETAPSGPRCWQFGTELRKFGRPLPAPSARAAVDQRNGVANVVVQEGEFQSSSDRSLASPFDDHRH